MCTAPPKNASAGAALLFWPGILTLVVQAVPSNVECHRLFEELPRWTRWSSPPVEVSPAEALLCWFGMSR